jgi:uncharacterized protein
MFSVFLFILAGIVGGDIAWWWLGDRMARSLRGALWWRLLLGLFMGGQILLVFWILGGRAVAEYLPSRPPQVLTAAAYLWHLLLLPAAWAVAATIGVLLSAWRLGRRFSALAARAGRRTMPAATPAQTEDSAAGVVPSSTTRRQFLGALTAAAPTLLTGGGLGYSLATLPRFRIRSIDLPLATLPRELDGLRIALVSDLHVGTFTTGPFVKRIVEATNRLDADLVLLPGDLINNSLTDLSDALDAVLKLQSRHGAYLCVGNHDLIDDGSEFVQRAKARVELLVNESRTVPVRGQPVQLLGLPWNLGEDRIERSVRQLARQLSPGTFPILLAHHPHAFDAAADAGIPLTVSGHTHGGQLMLSPGVGFGPLMYRYWSGLYRKPEQGGAALVVSNGAGHWFPLRTNAPAEIIHLTLHRGG